MLGFEEVPELLEAIMGSQVKEVGEMVEELLGGKEINGGGVNSAHDRHNACNGNGNCMNGRNFSAPNGSAFGDALEDRNHEELTGGGSAGLSGSTNEARQKLLVKLEKEGYTAPMYYSQLTTKVSKKAKAHPQAISESDLLAKLNSEELPRSYHAIEENLKAVASLDREAEEFRNPPRKPDISRLNYLKDYRTIISGHLTYFSAKARKSLKGSKRTHDVVLEEMVTTIDETHTHVVTALAHSARITDGLTAYQETVIEARLQNAANEWSKAFNAAKKASSLTALVAQYKDGSAPQEYSKLSVTERNLARLLQHSKAKMGENEAIAVHNQSTLAAVNGLETNIRTGMLELERFSTLIAQTVEDVQYTTQGTLLLRHGYKSVEALATSALTLRNVMALRVKQISDAIGVFNDSLNTAQANVTAEEVDVQSGKELPRIAVVGYERVREEALRLFAQRGVAEAKKVLYATSNARQ